MEISNNALILARLSALLQTTRYVRSYDCWLESTQQTNFSCNSLGSFGNNQLFISPTNFSTLVYNWKTHTSNTRNTFFVRW